MRIEHCFCVTVLSIFLLLTFTIKSLLKSHARACQQNGGMQYIKQILILVFNVIPTAIIWHIKTEKYNVQEDEESAKLTWRNADHTYSHASCSLPINSRKQDSRKTEN